MSVEVLLELDKSSIFYMQYIRAHDDDDNGLLHL